MFTLRKNNSKRASLSFLQQQNTNDIQQNCSSLLFADDLPRENLIFLMLNPGCFREFMRCSNAAGTQYSTASICNQICSLLVFSSRKFSRNACENEKVLSSDNDLIMDQQITVLLDAPKVPMKALRIVLRACQSALAYKIRQCILLERDWIIQHRVSLDVILREKYDFKVIVCPHSKLMNYIGLATLFDLQPIWREKSTAEESRQQPCKSSLTDANNNEVDIGNEHNGKALLAGKWVDEKKAFSLFFSANPSYSLSMGNSSTNISTASLLRLMRKDCTILIELVEHDLDSVTVSRTPPMPAAQQTQNRSLLADKKRDFVEEKRQKERPTDTMSVVGRIRQGMPSLSKRSCVWDGSDRMTVFLALAQQPQRNSLLSAGGFSFSVTSLQTPTACEKLQNKTQKEDEFEYMCITSVGSITERNGDGILPIELQKTTAGDEFAVFSVCRVAASVRLLLDWIDEHGERRLRTLNEHWKRLWTKFHGEIFYLDFIESERVRLSEEIEEKLNELANANDEAEQMERKREVNGLSEKPKELRTLEYFLHRTENQIYRLRNALNAYKLRIDNARRFKASFGEFHKECDTLILLIYSHDSVGKNGIVQMDRKQIEERIKSIKERQNNIEKCVDLASETLSSFRFLLYQREKIGQSNKKEDDYAEEDVLRQISADSDALAKRRQRFEELIELWVRMLNSLVLSMTNKH